MLLRLVIVFSMPLLVRGLPTIETPSTSPAPCVCDGNITYPGPPCQPHSTVPAVVLLQGSYQCFTGMAKPRPPRDDYKYSPGIGAHKLHTRAATWNEARKMCNEEGGHLAIINSLIEARIMMELFSSSGSVKGAEYRDIAYVGVHDLYKEGEWVTILGDSIYKTGYSVWSDKYGGQPDNGGGSQHCGVLFKDGGLDDVHCGTPFAFFCELPMTCFIN